MAMLVSWCRIPIHKAKIYTWCELTSCDFTHSFQRIAHNSRWIWWFSAFDAKGLNKWPLQSTLYYQNASKLHIQVYQLPYMRDTLSLRWTLLWESMKALEFSHWMIEPDSFEANKCPWFQNMFEHFGTISWLCMCLIYIQLRTNDDVWQMSLKYFELYRKWKIETMPSVKTNFCFYMAASEHG